MANQLVEHLVIRLTHYQATMANQVKEKPGAYRPFGKWPAFPFHAESQWQTENCQVSIHTFGTVCEVAFVFHINYDSSLIQHL